MLPTAATEYSRLVQAVENATLQMITEKRLVGAVVAIAHKGTAVCRVATGLADREAERPMTEDTIFRYSSITKLFTAMATAALVHQGKLTFDTPVSAILPYFTPSLPDGTRPVITIRHLLSHTAGLDYGFNQEQEGPYHMAGVCDGLELSSHSLETNIRRLAQVPLLHVPGTTWNYSLATDVLGAVVAAVCGTTLQEAIHTLVTAPLGMDDAAFHVHEKKAKRLSTAYVRALPQPVRMNTDKLFPMERGHIHFSPHRILHANQFPSGGGGMAGTADEVLTLLEVVRTGGKPLANKDIMEEMMRPQTEPDAIFPGKTHCLGWAMVENPVAAKEPHTSPGTIYWGGVYGHFWFMDRKKELSVALLTNTAPEGLWGKTVGVVREAVYSHLPN